MDPSTPTAGRDFIRQIIDADLASGKHLNVVTRFPPEPNGYLHIGHAKAICLNFGLAAEYGQRVPARCHLRFDDTNPEKEEQEYIDAIEADVRWLGFDWGGHLYHASDYFQQLYDFSEELIGKGLAYVDDQSAEQIRATRGTLTEPGVDSPWRGRSVEENLDLFRRMRAGEFPDGSRVLRARVDMASPNLNLRDPALWRIRRAPHPRTGEAWLIYPMYDYTHPLSDALEFITHSICTLEFENHRPLYDWAVDNVSAPCKPRQIEFARLNLSYTVMSKRKLLQLVKEGRVDGWDDPRLPTLCGLRRRGYTPEAIRDFCERIGVAKRDSVVDVQLLEHCLREDLNRRAPRRMAVLDPLPVTIENWEPGRVEWLEAVNNPEDGAAGTRSVPFSGELFIERDDFMEDPPKKWFRLAPGAEVRLRWGYLFTCTQVIRDADGRVARLTGRIDPASRGGNAPDGRKVKGTIHWVSAAHAVAAEVRLYDHLFAVEKPGGERDFLEDLNPDSLVIRRDCRLEPALAEAKAGEPVQFERLGYFNRDSRVDGLVFNRTVGLRDTWSKEMSKG
ncbi:MAG: glutamine--tRNA ligase/YqeY domain fusion protein [bacterium]|nr:glutamine--tRNA ligase/YqeY domain fusion protein [bacterium]